MPQHFDLLRNQYDDKFFGDVVALQRALKAGADLTIRLGTKAHSLLSRRSYTLLAALNEALECPQVAHFSRADRLALAMLWLIESVADEFDMPVYSAADEVARLCGLAKKKAETAPH